MIINKAKPLSQKGERLFCLDEYSGGLMPPGRRWWCTATGKCEFISTFRTAD